ncbi:MAG TPA: PAS domain S-box protein [Candidatus Sulfotelmatobacter sp.]|jgi:PAS domain S-box-containing protein|nr:PAS domain S-box protein [Candidatus Sulfotelmatobacter sp.]
MKAHGEIDPSCFEALIMNIGGTVYESVYTEDGPKIFIKIYSNGTASGYLSSEFNGMPLDLVRAKVHPDDRVREFDELGKELARHDYVERVCRVFAPDGSLRWLRAREQVVDRRDGIIKCTGIALDVTDLFKAKETAKNKDSLYKKMMEDLPVGVISLDEAGSINQFNDEAQKIFFNKISIGQNFHEYGGFLFWPNGTAIKADDQPLMAAFREKRALRNVELLVKCSDDSQVFVCAYITPILNADVDVSGMVVALVDISDRKKADADQKETSRRLEMIIGNLPGRAFRIRYANNGEKYILYFGGEDYGVPSFSSRQEVKVSPDFYHADDREMLYVKVPQQLRGRGACEYTFRVHTPDSVRWLRAREKVVQYQAGEMITEGISFDVTEEVQAKLAFEESERLYYREMVNLTAVGVVSIDPSGQRILYGNERFQEMLGPSAETALDVRWNAAIHPDDRAAVVGVNQQAITGRVPFRGEYRLLHHDGKIIWVMSQTVPRFGVTGEFQGWIGVLTDITERKKHEEALERLNRVLRTLSAGNDVLVRSASEDELLGTMCEVLVATGRYRMAWVGLAEEDTEKTIRPMASAGEENGYLALARPCWGSSMRGNGPTGLAIRTGIPQVNSDTARNPLMQPWRELALERGFLSNISLPLKTNVQTFGCLNIYAGHVDAFNAEEVQLFSDFANNIAYGISAMREKRRREEIETDLNQAQKMETLGVLAGSIAHDFNNLLGAILGFARFILEDSPAGASNHHYASRILSAGRRGKAMIGQILSFARREKLRFETFHLSDLLVEAQDLLSATIPASTNVIFGSCDADILIKGDRDQMMQILLNLVTNAHDSLDGVSGMVSILVGPTKLDEGFLPHLSKGLENIPPSLAPVEIWRDQQGLTHGATGCYNPSVDYVSLTIRDTGCGMGTELLERIFTPFFTTKPKGHGTGLGLAMVRDIVVAHNGALIVESCPGFGSSFEVILPCAKEVAAERQAEDPPSRFRAPVSGRVLLVDDDSDFGEMLLSALERGGFEVSPCSDPLDALAGIHEYVEFWDAVVADQTMPNMTGLELIREIKRVRPDLPCILCTGYAIDNLDETHLREAGVLTLLRKPLDIDQLISTLAQVMPSAR